MITREYQQEDFPALEKIIRKIWYDEEFEQPTTAEKMSKAFFSSCLTNYTFSRVAVDKGVPIGIILVKNQAKHKCPVNLRVQQIKDVTSLFLSKEGRKLARVYGQSSRIDRELLEECGIDYPAEISLFAVDPAYRGKGIGKELFQEGLAYIEQEALDTFYLFTDTSCNFGFYEHQGMKRRCEKEHTFTVDGQKETMDFYIYDYQCS